MPWGTATILPGEGKPRDEALRADYKRLIAIRRAHPALSRGVHEKLVGRGRLLRLPPTDAASDDAVVVAVNRGDEPLGGAVPGARRSGAAGRSRDAWNGVALPLTTAPVETTLGC